MKDENNISKVPPRPLENRLRLFRSIPEPFPMRGNASISLLKTCFLKERNTKARITLPEPPLVKEMPAP